MAVAGFAPQLHRDKAARSAVPCNPDYESTLGQAGPGFRLTGGSGGLMVPAEHGMKRGRLMMDNDRTLRFLRASGFRLDVGPN